MDWVPHLIPDTCTSRLSEEEFGKAVWSEKRVRNFLEGKLGLSKSKRIKGRIISGHNEALDLWQELISGGKLTVPFEVVHVDSHADLGLGISSWVYIMRHLLKYSVSERPSHNRYYDDDGNEHMESIGDYLLYAIAYRWIEKLTYCANPNSKKNDYLWLTMKDLHEEAVWEKPVENTIQLVYNPNMPFPAFRDTKQEKSDFLKKVTKEPEVPFLIIPNIDGIGFTGDFSYASLAQSPNYTPSSADFILDVFREYIEEI